MRVLTSPAQTGAVTLALPQDVQTEAYDYPEELFEKRVWHDPRGPTRTRATLARAAEAIRAAKRPLIVAGGGVLYSEATRGAGPLRRAKPASPWARRRPGKGSLPFDHPQTLGAIGVTGTPGANIAAREADLVIGIGTRCSDFTTASKTAFQNPRRPLHQHQRGRVRRLQARRRAAGGRRTRRSRATCRRARRLSRRRRLREPHRPVEGAQWEAEADRIYDLRHGPPSARAKWSAR